MRNTFLETMILKLLHEQRGAVSQRGDTIETIKRRAVEKKAAEEKHKAEARARAAYRRK